MKHNIMFVDDYSSVLQSLRWIFKDEPYNFFVFDRPTEALREMTRTKFSVVVTDQSMPEMSGIELLKEVKAKSPDTIGMIMSIFPPELMTGLDNGLVYRIIQKPWSIWELKEAVEMAVNHYEARMDLLLHIPPTQTFTRYTEQHTPHSIKGNLLRTYVPSSDTSPG